MMIITVFFSGYGYTSVGRHDKNDCNIILPIEMTGVDHEADADWDDMKLQAERYMLEALQKQFPMHGYDAMHIENMSVLSIDKRPNK